MTDLDILIRDLEAAKEEDQARLLNRALDFAHERAWIAFDAWERAKWWVEQEAYLDAARTLAPEGWSWEVGTTIFSWTQWYWAKLSDGKLGKEAYRSRTPALALCVAALRARRDRPT